VNWVLLQLAVFRLKTTENCCELSGKKNYSSNAEYVFTSLEDAQKAAEAFIHKEVMLYKFSLLEEEHAERVLAVV